MNYVILFFILSSVDSLSIFDWTNDFSYMLSLLYYRIIKILTLLKSLKNKHIFLWKMIGWFESWIDFYAHAKKKQQQKTGNYFYKIIILIWLEVWCTALVCNGVQISKFSLCWSFFGLKENKSVILQTLLKVLCFLFSLSLSLCPDCQPLQIPSA